MWSGTEPIAYAYQWRRCDAVGDDCADIASATGQSYTLAPADVGSSVRVAVTAANAGGSSGAASAQTGLVAAAAPANTAAPSIAGSSLEGATLTADPGNWTGTPPISYAYRWRRCDLAGGDCADINGAAAETYTLTLADVGATIRVVATASNSADSTSATSAQTLAVMAVPVAPANTGAPTVSGTAQVGHTLSADPGTWTGTQPISYAYRWRRCDSGGAGCADIVPAGAQTYILASNDVGATIRVVVTASNSAGSDSATSAQTAIVQAAPVLPVTTIETGPPDPSKSSAASFGFSADKPGATFECRLDAASFIACTSPRSYTDLAEGVHSFQVRATDSAGLEGAPSTYDWIVDLTAPQPSLTSPAPADATADTTPTFSGQAGVQSGDLGSVVVSVYAGANTLGTLMQTLTAARQPDGSYAVEASAPLATGTYSAEAEQLDAAGNAGRSVAVTFTIDTSAPTVTLTAPADGSSTTGATPTFAGLAGSGPGDNSGVVVKVYAGASAGGLPIQVLTTTRAADGGYGVDASAALADGLYTAQAEQADVAGNLGRSAPTTFRIDTTPPSVTIVSPEPGGSTPQASVTFQGIVGTAVGDNPGVTLRVYAGTAATGTPVQTLNATVSGSQWTTTANPLAEGPYTARAEQADTMGNVGRSAPVTFTVVRLYRDEVLADSPRAYWRLGESSGTTAASQTGTGGGTYLGGSTLNQAGALSGDPNTAAQFNGVGGNVRIPNSSALNPTTALSLEAWVKPDALPTASASILRKGAPMLLRLTPSGGVTFRLTKGGAVNEVSTGGALIAPAQWSHIVSTWDGATMKVYINATLRASASLAGPIDSGTDSFHLASSYGSYDFFAGAIDEAALYPAALTQARVQAHYNRARLINSGAPNVTLASPADGSAHTDARPTFAGAAGTDDGDSAIVRVRLWAGASPTGDTVAVLEATRLGESWSVQPGAPLANGTYTARAEQANDIGFIGTSSLVTFRVDAAPPVVTVTSPVNGSQTFDRIPIFEGGAGAAIGDASNVSVRIFSGSGTGGPLLDTLTGTSVGGNWSARPSAPLAPGAYTIQAEQRDDVGNLGTSPAVTFTVLESRYRTEVMADQPRAYWRLGESTGTTAASETQTNAGTYLNGVRLRVDGAVRPDTNKAVSLDGVNDNVRAPNSTSLNPTTAISVEAWVNPSALPASSATIVRKGTQYLLRVTSTGVIAFRIYKAGAAIEVLSPSGALSTGNWRHVVATWDGVNMAIYVDGSLRASRALSGPGDSGTEALHIGASYGSYDFFAGAVDDVAVYGSALSQGRIQAHYDTVDARPPSVRLDTPAAGTTMGSTPNFGGLAGTALGDAGSVTVKVYAGTTATGTPVGTYPAEVRSSGAYSVQTTSPLVSGTYTAQAEQLDQSGIVGLSQPATFTVDATADPALIAAGDIAGCDSSGDEATAALLDRLPGVVQTVGDHAYEDGSPLLFANCYDPSWGRHKARTHPSVGDHDYGTADASGYFNYFGTAASPGSNGYYSYDLGAWHIVVTNGICGEVPGGCEADSPQDRWLIQDLAAHPTQCTLGVIAGPRFSSGATHGSEPEFERMWQDFYDAGADVILSADDHIYERFARQTPDGTRDDIRGLRGFVVGTGGRSHYPIGTVAANSEVRNNDTFGVLKLTLHAGSYSWQFVPEAGKTFTDSGVESCH